MVSAPDSGASGPGSCSGRGHCVVQDTLLSWCPFPPWCINVKGEFNAGGVAL